MSAINYTKKLFWLLSIAISACQANSVKDLTKALHPSSSPSAVAASVDKALPACRWGGIFAQVNTPKSPALSEAVFLANETQTISSAGIGPARLGMTFGQLRQRLGPEAEFKVESPFVVDFDAIAVSQCGQVQYYILYPAGTTLADTNEIQILLTENPNFRTAQGVGSGTLLRQAKAVYGDVTLSYNTSNESREYVKFARQSQRNIHFRPVAVGQKFAGIYPLPEREYNETKIYHSDATIRSVEVACLPQICTK